MFSILFALAFVHPRILLEKDHQRQNECHHILTGIKRILSKVKEVQNNPILKKFCQKIPESQRSTCISIVENNISYVQKSLIDKKLSISEVCEALNGFNEETDEEQEETSLNCIEIVDMVSEELGKDSDNDSEDHSEKIQKPREDLKKLNEIRKKVCGNVEKEVMFQCHNMVKSAFFSIRMAKGEKQSSSDICANMRHEKPNLFHKHNDFLWMNVIG